MKKRSLQQFMKRNEGVALIEFAFILPILFLLLFGCIEMTRLLLIHQRLERSGYVLADITTQYLPATAAGAAGEINQTEMDNNIFPQFSRVMSPYEDSTQQAVIITSVKKISGDAVIQWQTASRTDTLTGCDTSVPKTCVQSVVNGLSPAGITPAVRGTAANFSGEAANIVNSMRDDTNFIVVETFYYFRPIFSVYLQQLGKASGFNFVLAPQIYTKRTFFAPRNGEMVDLPPTFPVP